MVCRVSHTVRGVQVPGCVEWLVFTGVSRGSITLALVLSWVREAKLAETVSPHHDTADPTSQAPRELRADTCRAGEHETTL